MQRPTLFLFAMVTLVASVHSARADFLYSDFSNTNGLKLNGDTAQVGSALRLAKASDFSSGSAFTTNQIALGTGNSFSTYFQFQISNSGGLGDGDGAGADGLVFVVQTVSNNVGSSGGGIGYSSISPSMGVEFDTFDNGSGFGDPNGNHVGIDLNGNIVSVQTQTEPVRFNNGEIWNAWIDYNGDTHEFEARWSQSTVRPIASQLSRTLDLAALLGQDSAFIGFTSATGSGIGDHDILHWEFRGEFAPIPEPASVITMSLGAIGLAASRKSRWIFRRS